MERQVSSRDSDEELQTQELQCLTSMLTAEEFQQSTESSGKLEVFPSLEAPFYVFCVPEERVGQVTKQISRLLVEFDAHTASTLIHDLISAEFRDRFCTVENLPSIQVIFWYPENYPSEVPPNVKIFCPWMEGPTVVALENAVVNLWRRNGGLVVLYDVYEFLNCLFQDSSIFPLGDLLVLVPDCRGTTTGMLDDEGGKANIIRVKDAATVMETLRIYDVQRKELVFDRELQQCPVCLTSRLGTEYFRLRSCGHRCCSECLRAACSTHITEGSIRLLKCLMCDEEIHPHDVAKLISSEDLDKFDRLQLNNALNGMGDVVYCPRPGCNQAVIKEPDGDIAQCFCGYVFCSICRHGSHGVEPCRFESVDKIEEKLASLSLMSDKDYVRRKLLKALDDAKSDMFIEERAKRCPRCWAPMQKTDGCNHMTCTCGCHFCWICSKPLSKDNPYEHFNNPNNRQCNQQLFFNAEEQENGEDLDEAVIMRAVEEVAEDLLPAPERWFDEQDMEEEMRMLLRRQLDGLPNVAAQPPGPH